MVNFFKRANVRITICITILFLFIFISSPVHAYSAESSTNSTDQYRTISVGKKPSAEAYCPSNGFIYVVNSGSDNVSVVDTHNNEVKYSIAVGSDPVGIAFDPTNGFMYVSNQNSENISVINVDSEKVTASIYIDNSTGKIAYDPSNDGIYVLSNSGVNSVFYIDPSLNKVGNRIFAKTVPNYKLTGLVYDPDNKLMYVVDGYFPRLVIAGFSAQIIEIDSTTNHIAFSSNTSLSAALYGIVYDSGNGKLYIPSAGWYTLLYMDRNYTNISGFINLSLGFPSNPDLIYVPNSGFIYYVSSNLLYANDPGTGVAILNPTSQKIVKAINITMGVSAIVYDPQNNLIYAANSVTNNVTIIPALNIGHPFMQVLEYLYVGVPSGVLVALIVLFVNRKKKTKGQ